MRRGCAPELPSDALIVGSTHPGIDSYVTLDPKVSRARLLQCLMSLTRMWKWQHRQLSGSAARHGSAGVGSGAGAGAGAGAGPTGYKRAIVFMVGGGCYTEYHNLQDLARVRTMRSHVQPVTTH